MSNFSIRNTIIDRSTIANTANYPIFNSNALQSIPIDSSTGTLASGDALVYDGSINMWTWGAGGGTTGPAGPTGPAGGTTGPAGPTGPAGGGLPGGPPDSIQINNTDSFLGTADFTFTNDRIVNLENLTGAYAINGVPFLTTAGTNTTSFLVG